MPRFLLLNPSNPVRQRLSRWGRCLTTGFPLLCHPSLTGGVVRRQVKPRPVYSLRQPMQALYYRGRYGHRKRKTLKVWLFVCAHALAGKEPKLEGLVVCLCAHSDTQIINQEKNLCKCRLRLSGAYVDATLAYAD